MTATDTLVKKVRRLVNEAENDSDVSLITEDMRSLDDTILELLPQAVALVQRCSHGGHVNVKALSNEAKKVQEVSDGSYNVALPGDFFKLVSLQLTSWKRACMEISSPESLDAVNAVNGSSCVGAFNPVCVESIVDGGAKVVKLFPCNASDEVVHFVYEAQFNVADGLAMCDSYMADAVTYACTSLLYTVFEKHDAAKPFMSYAMALCGGEKSSN